MSNIKISEMDEANQVSSDDVLPIVQNGSNKKAKLKTLSNTVQGLLVPDSIPIGTIVEYEGDAAPTNWEEVEGWITATLSNDVSEGTGLGGFKGIRYKKEGNHIWVEGSVSTNWDGTNSKELTVLPERF